MINSIANALVVGGGIGGMAAATELARRGVAVELIDIDPNGASMGRESPLPG